MGQGPLPYTSLTRQQSDCLVRIDQCGVVHCRRLLGECASILRDITVTFLYISPTTPFHLEPDYIVRKPMKQSAMIYCPYENIINFSPTSRIHFSANIMSYRPSAYSLNCTVEDLTECAHKHTHRLTDRHTKVKTVYLRVSLSSLGGYNKFLFTIPQSPASRKLPLVNLGHTT